MPGPFLHLRRRIIAQLLVDRGLGTDPAWWASGSRTAASDPAGDHDWASFAGNEPDYPANCLTTYGAVDQLDAVVLFSGEHVRHFGFQIKVRGRTDEVAGLKAEQLFDDLTRRAHDQTVIMADPVATYLVQSFPTVRQTDAYRAAPGSNLWAVSLNGFAVIVPHPIQG